MSYRQEIDPKTPLTPLPATQTGIALFSVPQTLQGVCKMLVVQREKNVEHQK